eukprot:6202981-Pleurochrysis_carterae.AAC.6
MHEFYVCNESARGVCVFVCQNRRRLLTSFLKGLASGSSHPLYSPHLRDCGRGSFQRGGWGSSRGSRGRSRGSAHIRSAPQQPIIAEVGKAATKEANGDGTAPVTDSIADATESGGQHKTQGCRSQPERHALSKRTRMQPHSDEADAHRDADHDDEEEDIEEDPPPPIPDGFTAVPWTEGASIAVGTSFLIWTALTRRGGARWQEAKVTTQLLQGSSTTASRHDAVFRSEHHLRGVALTALSYKEPGCWVQCCLLLAIFCGTALDNAALRLYKLGRSAATHNYTKAAALLLTFIFQDSAPRKGTSRDGYCFCEVACRVAQGSISEKRPNFAFVNL